MKYWSWYWEWQWFHSVQNNQVILLPLYHRYLSHHSGVHIIEHDLIGSEQDIHGSDVGIPIFVRINPFEHTIARWIEYEHGVMHGLSLFTLDIVANSSMRLTQFCAKICSLPTNGVRGSLNSMRTGGRTADCHGRQKADGNYSDFGAKKAAQNYRTKHINLILLFQFSCYHYSRLGIRISWLLCYQQLYSN